MGIATRRIDKLPTINVLKQQKQIVSVGYVMSKECGRAEEALEEEWAPAAVFPYTVSMVQVPTYHSIIHLHHHPHLHLADWWGLAAPIGLSIGLSLHETENWSQAQVRIQEPPAPPAELCYQAGSLHVAESTSAFRYSLQLPAPEVAAAFSHLPG